MSETSPLIMVIDDSADVLQVLTLLLRSRGYQIMTAPGGEEALRQMRERQPDLILCDIMMPGIDGVELCNAFDELNDPIDQRARFEEQAKFGEKGDPDAMPFDEDFVEALEYGMPPTVGFGLSERVFSFLVDKPIRDCVFFPIVREKK